MALCISQAHAEPGHLLKDLAEVTIGGEQVVDVGADALDGGYSCGHGCGFLSLLARLREEPTPAIYLHRGLDATARQWAIGARTRAAAAGPVVLRQEWSR